MWVPPSSSSPDGKGHGRRKTTHGWLSAGHLAHLIYLVATATVFFPDINQYFKLSLLTEDKKVSTGPFPVLHRLELLRFLAHRLSNY